MYRRTLFALAIIIGVLFVGVAEYAILSHYTVDEVIQ